MKSNFKNDTYTFTLNQTDILFLFVEIQFLWNGKRPKRTERRGNVQWTFLANGPAGAMVSGRVNGIRSRFEIAKAKIYFGCR